MKSTDTKQHSILNMLFLEAANDLLAVNGLKADVVRESSTEMDVHSKPSYVSILGATGEGVALSSMLTIDRELLISLYPLGVADIPQAYLEDWCRELNNQLVGRMKNKLLRYGVVVMLGLPVLFKGTDVSAVATSDLTINQHAIRTSNSKISLTLATLVDPELQLLERESSSDAFMPEGAVSLF